jgi:hypothetical protein
MKNDQRNQGHMKKDQRNEAKTLMYRTPIVLAIVGKKSENLGDRGSRLSGSEDSLSETRLPESRVRILCQRP